MRLRSCFVLLLLFLTFSVVATAQDQQTETAAERVEKLRAQLLEVQAKEDVLRARAQQLEESLKPENIERSLAGVGSTKPEELRESRRRQLTIERDGVLAQLRIVEASKQRLEAAIANAEASAYHESARSAPTPGQMLAATSSWSYRWLLLGGGGAAALALAGGVLFYRRRINLR